MIDAPVKLPSSVPGFRHTCGVGDAQKMRDWIANRGGVACWVSQDMGDPGKSWSTPALQPDGKPTEAPTWQTNGATPVIITDEREIGVCTDREVGRVRISLQRGSGLRIDLTSGSSRRVRKAVADAGIGAYYEFEDDEAVIMKPDTIIALSDWRPDAGGK